MWAKRELCLPLCGDECWWKVRVNSLNSTLVSAIVVNALLVLGMSLISSHQAWEGVKYALSFLLLLSPLLIAAYLLSGYMKVANTVSLVHKVFQKRSYSIIISASLFGALSPLCACTVVPLVSLLLIARVPLYAIMAFWLSAPTMSPDTYILTASILGFEFTNAKVFAAIFMGCFAGFLTMAVQKYGFFANPGKRHEEDNPEILDELGNQPFAWDWAFWKYDEEKKRAFWKEVEYVGYGLTGILFLAFFLESLLLAYVPPDLVEKAMGVEQVWAIPVSVFIGLPTYLNGFAAVPLIDGLIQSGMSSAAALSFMMAGAATSIPAVLAVYSIVKKGPFFWYLFLAFSSSMIVGYSFQFYLAL